MYRRQKRSFGRLTHARAYLLPSISSYRASCVRLISHTLCPSSACTLLDYALRGYRAGRGENGGDQDKEENTAFVPNNTIEDTRMFQTRQSSPQAHRYAAPSTVPHDRQRLRSPSWAASEHQVFGRYPEHAPPMHPIHAGDPLRHHLRQDAQPGTEEDQDMDGATDKSIRFKAPLRVFPDTKLRVGLVGAMNVGKSTLFNMSVLERIPTHNMVADCEGITRDAVEAHAQIGDLPFTIVDTPGIVEGALPMESVSVLRSCDVLLFITAADAGVRSQDRDIAALVESWEIPVIHVITRMDLVNGNDPLSNDVYSDRLGVDFGRPVRMSLRKRQGVDELIDALYPIHYVAVQRRTRMDWMLEDAAMAGEPRAMQAIRERNAYDPFIRVALIGRPNSGKSSLYNALLGLDRMRSAPESGTTRDSVETRCTYRGRRIQLIDTPGFLRIRQIRDKPFNEQLWWRTRTQIRNAAVCVIVFDAREGVPSKSDMILAYRCLDEGKAFCFAANKWDAVSDAMAVAEAIDYKLKRQLYEVRNASAVACSAHTGLNLELLLDHTMQLYDTYNKRISASKLTRYWRRVEKTVTLPHHISRVRVITQTNIRPPTFLLSLQTRDEKKKLPSSYENMVRNAIVEEFGFHGVPVRIVQQTKQSHPDVA